MIRAVPHVARMAEYALADLGDANVVSLAQNESAFPPSPQAQAAGQAALASNQLYPDPDWHELRAAICETHPVESDTVLCGAGSMELIGCLIRAFAGSGDEVLGTQYGYLFVGTAAQQAGARYITASEPDLMVDTRAILNAVTEHTRIVFVCNPGNPTGTRIGNSDLVALRGDLPDDVLLVVDQAYAEFDAQDHGPIFRLVDRGNTVVTRTLSKAYGLAGARVGWASCPPEVGSEIRKLLNPNNIPISSQAMAVAALRDQAYMHKVVADTATRRDALTQRVRGLGYHVPDSATNFVLIRFTSAEVAARADEALKSAGLILRGMGGYGLPDCLRATIGLEAAMTRLGDVLEQMT